MPKLSRAEKAAMAEYAAEASEREPEVVSEYVDADGDTVLEMSDGNDVVIEAEDPGTWPGVDDAGVVETAGALGLTEGYEFELVDTGRLSEHPKNANRGDVDAVGRSMLESGFYGAVVAQKSTGFILAGNHRYRVATEKGLTQIPTIWVDVDAVGAVRILLADNETARRATMDLGAQDALIQELKEVDPDLRGTGFDRALEDIAAEEEAEEKARAEAEKDEDDDPSGGGEGGAEYGAKYGVLVMCRDEGHQAEVYQQLADLELGELRVVAV